MSNQSELIIFKVFIMNPENIKARISIGKQEQGDIAFIYDFNLLKLLNVPPDSFFTNYHFLSIGAEFELNEIKYRILA